MATYANQEIIIRKKDAFVDAEHPYVKLNIDCVQKAMEELKGYEFQLYMILSMNQIGFELAFSPSALEKRYGGTRKTWGAARDTLKEKGYLVPLGGNRFEFLEEPMRDDPTVLSDTDAEAVFAQVPIMQNGKWSF